MPYSEIAKLPGAVRNLPKHGQEIWMAAYNSAYDEYDGDEEKCNATAWAAVKKAGYVKRGDKWVVEAAPSSESVVTESEAGLVLQRGDAFDTAGSDESADIGPVQVLEDASTNVETGDYHIIIIEAGKNEGKRRIYTDAALESLPADPYTGLQMHLDHDVVEGEAIGVRSLSTLASVITKSWVVPARESASGAAQVHGIAHVWPQAPNGFSANMRDPLFRKSVFVSHIADLRGHMGRESDGNTWQVVTEIARRHGVDWVTKPGARGRVAESDKGAIAPKESEMDWTSLTREALVEHRPDLVQEISTAAVTGFKATVAEDDETAKLRAQFDEAQKRATTAEARLRSIEITGAVREAVSVAGSGIPEAVREPVVARVSAQVSGLPGDKTTGDALKTTVAEAVKTEAQLFAAANGKPTIDLTVGAGGEQPSAAAQMQARMDAALGVGRSAS